MKDVFWEASLSGSLRRYRHAGEGRRISSSELEEVKAAIVILVQDQGRPLNLIEKITIRDIRRAALQVHPPDYQEDSGGAPRP